MKKNKGQANLPDSRLAKVFNFDSEDLAANRLGFITSAQIYDIPRWQRRLQNQLAYFFKLRHSKQRTAVGKRCGRITIHHEVKPLYHSLRSGITSMLEVFTLAIKDKQFRLNKAQFRALSNNVYYTIYYDESNHRIVAIERMEQNC